MCSVDFFWKHTHFICTSSVTHQYFLIKPLLRKADFSQKFESCIIYIHGAVFLSCFFRGIAAFLGALSRWSSVKPGTYITSPACNNSTVYLLNAVSVGPHSQQRVNENCVFQSMSLTTLWFAVLVSWPPGSSSGATHCARSLPGDTWEGHYEKAKVHRYDVHTVHTVWKLWTACPVHCAFSF